MAGLKEIAESVGALVPAVTVRTAPHVVFSSAYTVACLVDDVDVVPMLKLALVAPAGTATVDGTVAGHRDRAGFVHRDVAEEVVEVAAGERRPDHAAAARGGEPNWVTKPDFTSGKSGVAGGFGVSTGFTLPAVVGTLVPEIRLTS